MNKVLGATALAVLLGATAAIAQTTSPASPPASKPDTAEKMAPPAASTTTVTKEGLVLTEAQANAWIKKAIFSSDGKNVGEVTALKRDASGKVAELQAGIGGFLGMGETQVRCDAGAVQVGERSRRAVAHRGAGQGCFRTIAK